MTWNWMLTALGRNSAIVPFKALIKNGVMAYQAVENWRMRRSRSVSKKKAEALALANRKGQPVGRKPGELRPQSPKPPNADTGGKRPEDQRPKWLSASIAKLDLSEGDVVVLRFPRQVNPDQMRGQAEMLRELIDRKFKIICLMEPYEITTVQIDPWEKGVPDLPHGSYVLTMDNDDTPCIAINDEQGGWIHYPGGWGVKIEKWRKV